MRRHVLYASQERETSVGDAKASVLKLWLERRRTLLHGDAAIARLLALFWTLAKPARATALDKPDYVTFFQCVAKALVQSVSADHAARVAARDWLYDCAGARAPDGPEDEDQLTLSFAQFREALFQLADLVLPVESDAAAFAVFFEALRDAVAAPQTQSQPQPQPQPPSTLDDGASWPPAAARPWTLRPLKDVAKVTGAYLQKMPPNADHLAQIRGLASPDMDALSLKQLLLSYNPRKFALSRTFSSLFKPAAQAAVAPTPAPAAEDDKPERWQFLEEEETAAAAADESPPIVDSLLATAPLVPSHALSRESEDAFDEEDAAVASIEAFPALRIAVVGPPDAGKSRVAASLARRLGLQYVSAATAIEDAVAAKLTRDAERLERQRERAEARAAREADAAEAAGAGEGEGEGGSVAETVPDDEEDESMDEAEKLFGDAELAALQRGEALSLAMALPLVVAFATRSLLRGVGVVLDDVFPHEAQGLAVDYVVSLEMAREDARAHVQGFSLAPTSRRVYSARERAMLNECDAALRELGLSDTLGFEEPRDADDEQVGQGDGDDDGLAQRRARVADAVAAAQAALAAAKKNPRGDDEDDEAGGETAQDDTVGDALAKGDGGEVGEGTAALGGLAPAPSSPAERNEIVAPDEPIVPLGAMLADAFDKRYRAFAVRASGLKSSRRTQVIGVLAAQALGDILAQCLVAITNNALGISRAATSRAARPLVLPEELAASGSRADQLRWLLYGDWTDALAEGDTPRSSPPFANGPVDPQRPRALSRWRDCCVVSSSSSSSIVPGDPAFAAYFSGRVYLFASDAARAAFCATPLQFVRRRPPPAPRMLWILSSGALDGATAAALTSLVDGDHVRGTEVLAARHALQQEMALLEGAALASTAQLAEAVADTLADKSAWILCDLIPSPEVVDVLRARGCLPDAVVVLTVDDVQTLPTQLDRHTYERFAATFLSGDDPANPSPRLAELLAGTPSVRVVRSALCSTASDTRTALARVLSPLAPRVDASEDGSARAPDECEDEHARVFGPAAQEDEEEPEQAGDATEGAETSPPMADALGYDAEQRAWLARRARMGETAQFCAVSLAARCVLVPGLPAFVASFGQKLYAFAAEKERAAFIRDPEAFVPGAPRATQGLVPVVWLLGVRGSDVAHVARAVAADVTVGGRVGVLDDSAVAARVARRLRAQLLLPLDKQAAALDVYVDELSAEFARLTTSGVWDAVVVAALDLSAVPVPRQLEGQDEGDEGSSATDAPPPLPSPELLARCFERDVVPTLVVPLEMPEAIAVARQLASWRAAQPVARPPLRKPVDGDADAEAEPEEEDLAAREAAETVRLQEQYQRDKEALGLALETLRARGLSLTPPVRVRAASSRAVVKSVAATIAELRTRAASLFEWTERVNVDHAQRLLRSGEVLVGKHAMRCPVTGDDPCLSPPVCALVYRSRLYFPASAAARAQCELAPAAWLVDACASQPPLCRVTCAVVGAPRAAKTALARRLAAQFGLVYVSPRSAVGWARQCLAPHQTLWQRLQATNGTRWQQLDAALVHDAVVARLCGADCQRRGWVLDDYVASPDQLTRCLVDVHPGVLFVLDGTASWQQRGTPSASERELLTERLTAWHTGYWLELLDVWTRTFGALHVRQLEGGAWQQLAQASEALREHSSATRQYALGVATARAVRLAGVLRAQSALDALAHDAFGVFCPVELASGRYHATDASQRELCVECEIENGDNEGEARRVVLWLASEANARAFCASPTTFLSAECAAHARALVAQAPVDASLVSLLAVADCEFPEMKGYCPVTFQRGTGDKDWQAIVKGSVFYRVSYQDKAFFCASERARRAFLAEPTKYAALVLPTKLPPQLQLSSAFKSCPGRLEQELSRVLNETLLVLGAARPKFLGVSPSASACVYMALLLKTRATKALPDHIRARYAERLRAYERDCQVCEQLRSAMLPGDAATSRGAGVKGARAVRELSASASASALGLEIDAPVADDASGELLRRRFDELVRSAQLEPQSRGGPTRQQQPSAPNALFRQYVAPLTATASNGGRN